MCVQWGHGGHGSTDTTGLTSRHQGIMSFRGRAAHICSDLSWGQTPCESVSSAEGMGEGLVQRSPQGTR